MGFITHIATREEKFLADRLHSRAHQMLSGTYMLGLQVEVSIATYLQHALDRAGRTTSEEQSVQQALAAIDLLGAHGACPPDAKEVSAMTLTCLWGMCRRLIWQRNASIRLYPCISVYVMSLISEMLFHCTDVSLFDCLPMASQSGIDYASRQLPCRTATAACDMS